MAEREPFHGVNASFVIAIPRGPQLLAGLAAPLAVVWMAAIGSPLNLGALPGGWAATVALMAAAIAVAIMLVVAVALVAADWMAEIKSRQAWAAIGVVADDLVTTPVARAVDQRDDFYRSANTEALGAALRAHRHTANSSTLRPVVAVGSTDVASMSARMNAVLATAAPIVCPISDDERTDLAGSVVDVVASCGVGAADRAQRDALEAFRVRAPIGPTAIQDKRRELKVMGVNRRAARLTRLVANDRPRVGWPSSDQTSTPRTIPIKIVSDIIIFGQGKHRRSGGDGPPRAVPGGSVPSTGVSTRTSIVASTTSDRRQHPRSAILQPEVSFEARRQLVALAEALARQAAREDDAEQIDERSHSPPDIVAGVRNGGGGRDDTS